MKTTGINTQEELSKNGNSEDPQFAAEINMKEMMTSCYTYGGIEKTSYNFERYLMKYRKELSYRTFNEVYNEQKTFLEGFKIVFNTYTDCDGLNYNSLVKL
jgi:hypothetical protein